MIIIIIFEWPSHHGFCEHFAIDHLNITTYMKIFEILEMFETCH
jgi:hypothetical protein